MNEEIENFSKVLKATSDYETADFMLKCFIKSRPQYDYTELIETVSKIDERFLGYTGVIILKYTSANIRTNGLSLGAAQTRVLKAGNYEITLIAREAKNV